MSALDIRGSGTTFAVYQGSTQLGGYYTSTGNAIAALRGVERRRAPVLIRPCLCCSAPFTSAGKTNRLCRQCKAAV